MNGWEKIGAGIIGSLIVMAISGSLVTWKFQGEETERVKVELSETTLRSRENRERIRSIENAWATQFGAIGESLKRIEKSLGVEEKRKVD